MFIGVPRLNWHKSIHAFVPAFLLLNFCGKVRITWLLLSIEKGQAKLLWCEDKSVEEAVEAEKLGAHVKEGDLIKIESLPEGLQVEFLEEETENIKEKARVIKEQLLKRNDENN
ncbi:hypothetical protein RRU94_18510 [Domibacillus sp. DTU_2020_1001157_1_SI_ALB_TIR_016]|uniref:hypothetical protein n=1 Tax=Domibacillus sp. DTU_2020_1001157_1_SI_ALB_TIR_016 TaxID=3077789 RepID=UPI0028E7B5BB|nr:hypothetical protein [Domibacillus sp. DTU_2020_1001157_1_SI_ALB_TIR_016]WNS79522.1 hypothetical protein RRU94_18510 [Domibacillus sp. DTU_2020_1001157_1_SI_ALB_TIR_016]